MAGRTKIVQPLFTATALGKLLNMSTVHVGRLAKEGKLTKRKDGRYALSAVTEYVNHMRENRRNPTNHAQEIDAEKLRRLKRENDIEEELVAPVEVLEGAVERWVAVLIPVLENIPLILKRQFPELTGDQIQVIKAGIAEGRNALADLKIPK